MWVYQVCSGPCPHRAGPWPSPASGPWRRWRRRSADRCPARFPPTADSRGPSGCSRRCAGRRSTAPQLQPAWRGPGSDTPHERRRRHRHGVGILLKRATFLSSRMALPPEVSDSNFPDQHAIQRRILRRRPLPPDLGRHAVRLHPPPRLRLAPQRERARSRPEAGRVDRPELHTGRDARRRGPPDWRRSPYRRGRPPAPPPARRRSAARRVGSGRSGSKREGTSSASAPP